MCRGRHRVENRVGEVQARGGGGRGGVGSGWLRTSLIVSVLCYKCCSLAPEMPVCVSVCEVTIFTAVLSNCTHFTARVIRILRMAVRPSLISRGRSCRGGKRPRGSRERAPVYVQCEPKDNDEVAHQQLPSNFAISFEAGWRSQDFELPDQSQ